VSSACLTTQRFLAASLTGSGSLSGGRFGPVVELSGEGRILGAVRAAVQELRDSSQDDLSQILAEIRALRAQQLVQPTAAAAVAVSAESRGMPRLGELVRARAKWGVITILAAIIGAGVEHEVYALAGWNPPSITVVRQMSRAQMDELAQQIEHQLEQWERSQQHGGQQPPTPPRQGSPVNVPRH
jgi:hypothetical protein